MMVYYSGNKLNSDIKLLFRVVETHRVNEATATP